MADGDNVLKQYHLQKINDEMKDMLEKAVKGQRGKVIKTVALKPEWRELWKIHQATHKAVKETAVAAETASRKHNLTKENFWNTIHGDLDDVSGMSYNRETEQIEIYDDLVVGDD